MEVIFMDPRDLIAQREKLKKAQTTKSTPKTTVFSELQLRTQKRRQEADEAAEKTSSKLSAALPPRRPDAPKAATKVERNDHKAPISLSQSLLLAVGAQKQSEAFANAQRNRAQALNTQLTALSVEQQILADFLPINMTATFDAEYFFKQNMAARLKEYFINACAQFGRPIDSYFGLSTRLSDRETRFINGVFPRFEINQTDQLINYINVVAQQMAEQLAIEHQLALQGKNESEVNQLITTLFDKFKTFFKATTLQSSDAKDNATDTAQHLLRQVTLHATPSSQSSVQNISRLFESKAAQARAVSAVGMTKTKTKTATATEEPGWVMVDADERIEPETPRLH